MTPPAYDLVAPETPYIRPVHPGDRLTYHGMNQREIHANEGQYIARVSDFKTINQLEQQLTNLLLSAYNQKMACSNHGPRHSPDKQTATSNLLSPLQKLWTNHSNDTEPETRRMYKSHIQSQRTHRPDLGPNH